MDLFGGFGFIESTLLKGESLDVIGYHELLHAHKGGGHYFIKHLKSDNLIQGSAVKSSFYMILDESSEDNRYLYFALYLPKGIIATLLKESLYFCTQ